MKNTDIRVVDTELYFLPVETRVPLKFGPETLTSVTCARVRATVETDDGVRADGWGETPLSVQWVWPSSISYEVRHEALKAFTAKLSAAWTGFDVAGHPIEIGHEFLENTLPGMLEEFNAGRAGEEPMPWLAALVCCSAMDIAVHDAYGVLHGVPVYETYNAKYMNRDLASFIEPDDDAISFEGKYPADFLVYPRPDSLPAWHLVGGKDLLDDDERDGSEPADGYPVTLPEWVERDGLKCLKVKLRGNDTEWDYDRLLKVGEIGMAGGVEHLSSDFNCTVTDPEYVNDILDRLAKDRPEILDMILYVEQPFPYDLEKYQIDVHSVSERKPLFMDESAHDWRLVRLGRKLGWTGVALKTCKTQTGAIFSLCWAKAHGMALMVQDLTNPMLAQVPHVLLAAHAGTIMGVETNGMQFYPEASLPESEVHPGIYTRQSGSVDLASITGPGFGYRLDEIDRTLPKSGSL